MGLCEHRNALGPKSSWEFLVQPSSDCWLLTKTPVPCSSSEARARTHTHTHTHIHTYTHINCFWCYMFWIPLSCSAATAFPNIDPHPPLEFLVRDRAIRCFILATWWWLAQCPLCWRSFLRHHVRVDVTYLRAHCPRFVCIGRSSLA